MRPILLLLSCLLLPAALAAVPAVPSAVSGTDAQWREFTAAAVASGDFAGWRDALGRRLREDLPAARLAQADTPAAASALAQWMFLREVLAADPEALRTIAAGPNGAEFLTWLLGNGDALRDYNGIAAIFRLKGKRTHGLEAWRDIAYADATARDPGLWRRVATAIAVTFAEQRGDIDPRARFAFYRSSHRTGQLVPYFDQALPFELALTVHGANRPDDDLEWAQDATPKDKKNQKDVGGYGHSLVGYRLHNYRDVSVQVGDYFDRKRNDLGTVMEYGSVCGGISHMNIAVATAHGAPGFTVGQPGHCAYVWKSDAKTWSGGNFVSGWTETHDSHQQGFWLSSHSANINLVSEAVESAGWARAERLRALATVWRDSDAGQAQEILAAATTACPLHYAAWRERIDAALAWSAAPAPLWHALAAEIARAHAKYPMAINDLLSRFDTQKLFPGAADKDIVSQAAGVARFLTSVPHADQWDLIYPAWKPWFTRQLTALGVPEKGARQLVDGTLEHRKRKQGAAVPEGVWQQIPAPRRPQVEALFTALLPAVETDGTLFKGVASAWLALVAEDAAANARASGYFQGRLANAADLRELEMLAEAVLNATRESADARSRLVASIRARVNAERKPDPGRVDSLLGLLAKHDFRDGASVGVWAPGQVRKDGESTLAWDITPKLAKVAGDYALHLNFRWKDGDALAVKAVRLFENGAEISADTKAETADPSLRPAVLTVRLPKPKPGAKYEVRATATGGADSAGVVLLRADPAPAFNKEDWAGIGGWGGKEIRAATEITAGWHEMEFDATAHAGKPGPVFVLFKYNSYGSPRVMNVRLCVDGREVSSDLHSCNPISGANTLYTLRLPAPPPAGAKVTVKALFSPADGWGTVYVRKQGDGA